MLVKSLEGAPGVCRVHVPQVYYQLWPTLPVRLGTAQGPPRDSQETPWARKPLGLCDCVPKTLGLKHPYFLGSPLSKGQQLAAGVAARMWIWGPVGCKVRIRLSKA